MLTNKYTFFKNFTYGLCLLLLSITFLQVQAQEVTTLTTFDQEHIYFGSENRRTVTSDFVFPDAQQQFSEILMHFTLACPDGGCDDWDRYADVRVLVPTGMMDSTVAMIDTTFDASGIITQIDTTWNAPFEIHEPFEIFRYITPYGGSFSDDWEWTYTSDLTDYRPLLTEDVKMELFIDTWVQPGWEITMVFEMTEGQPEFEAYKIENLWNNRRVRYGNLEWDVEENFLTPKTIIADEAMHVAKVRIYNTGHGFGFTDNAAEFSPKTHKIVVDGLLTETFDQFLWRDDCADNPLSPQAGTWQYNRAGWCPGDKADPWDYDISHLLVQGEPATIDYNLQPYQNLCSPLNPDCTTSNCAGATCSDGGDAYYRISSQLIYYRTQPQVTLDAETTQLLGVNGLLCDKDVQPQIRIRNNGADNLTSLVILYRQDTDGYAAYVWAGDLAFAQSAIIDLPSLTITDNDVHTYDVTLGSPNGGTDLNLENDLISSSFRYAHNNINLTLMTDNFADETSFQLIDESNTSLVFYEGNGYGSLDTINLSFCMPNGCFKLRILDSYGDGLNGSSEGPNYMDGYYELTDANGEVLASLQEPNFGDVEETLFCLETNIVSGTNGLVANNKFSIAPNPSTGMAQVNIQLQTPQALDIKVHNLMGQLVHQQAVAKTQNKNMLLDLSTQASGVYMVSICNKNGEQLFNERLVIVE